MNDEQRYQCECGAKFKNWDSIESHKAYHRRKPNGLRHSKTIYISDNGGVSVVDENEEIK